MSKGEDCCCGPAAKNDIKYIEVGEYSISRGPDSEGGCCCAAANSSVVPGVGFNWKLSDKMGEIAVRLGFKRMDYAIAPGLYAVGKPDENSPVLVSANYKLSFDVLRRDAKIDAWVLVIDTKGVNVWCAAGKGTFCAAEIIKRIQETKLEEVIKHKNIILPLLSAPGVAAHEIRRQTGFKPVFGPVEARDIKKFIDNGMENDTAMKTVEFPLWRRVEVSWLELVMAMDKLFWPMIAVIVLSGIGSRGFVLYDAVYRGMFYLYAALTGMVSGTVLFSMLLPALPGRYFSVKGIFSGLLGSIFFVLLSGVLAAPYMYLRLPASVIIIISIASFTAMNYTGCTTFTSISGVKKEVKDSIGFIIAGGIISVLLIITEMIMRVII